MKSHAGLRPLVLKLLGFIQNGVEEVTAII